MQKEEFQLLIHEFMQRPVAFHPALARAAGSAAAGLFLSQLFYWHGKGVHPAGWIYKDHHEWQEETCLTQDEQRGARKLLRSKGIIEESDVRKEGIDKFKSTLCFKINFDALQKCILSEIGQQSRMVDSDGNIPPRDAENPNPGVGISHPGVGFSAVHSTQSTSETSQKAAARAPARAAPAAAAPRRKRKGDQAVQHGVELWTPGDVEGLLKLVEIYGAELVAKVAATLRPAPGHRAPLLSAVAAALAEADARAARDSRTARSNSTLPPMASSEQAAAGLAAAKAALQGRAAA